ncbi:hypothetical protein [Streptomyces sp. NPDC051286]|uniref:hypothetical protein n=1 Tax=Streptomyces sp. NPDC051286 TaxID=3365647 RepID=UPI0037BA6164
MTTTAIAHGPSARTGPWPLSETPTRTPSILDGRAAWDLVPPVIIAENFTAAMTLPYLDGCGCAAANSGLSFVDPHAMRGHVTRPAALM